MVREVDFQGLNVLEYAKLTENGEVVGIVEAMLNGQGVATLKTLEVVERQESKVSGSGYELQTSEQHHSRTTAIDPRMHVGLADPYHNEAWRKRDFEEDFKAQMSDFKSKVLFVFNNHPLQLEEQHLSDLKEAQIRL